MATVPLSLLATALASLLSQEAGVVVTLYDGDLSRAAAAEKARGETCIALKMDDCDFPLNAFYPASSGAEVMNVAFPDGREQPVCLLRLPSSEGSSYGTKKWLSERISEFDASKVRQVREPNAAEVTLYGFLAQAASCARSPSREHIDAQREAAFASLASELILSDPAFLSGGESAGGLMAAGLNSEAGRIGSAVGRRILVEGWKENLAGLVSEAKACRPVSPASRQPFGARPAADLEDEKKLFACLRGEARVGTSYQVTDVSLVGISSDMEDAVDLLQRFDREVAGIPSQQQLSEIRTYVFDDAGIDTFGGSVNAVLSYAWGTANQIVGLP